MPLSIAPVAQPSPLFSGWEGYERLARIKARFDPQNLFHLH
ncbi:BBE domain-containing protein [Halomonas korlensis]|nr:BBE domain-containing protein [Halomonas korlensis]